MKVVLAGGSGYLGKVLASGFAAKGHEVVVLTRSPKGGTAWRQAAWDGKTFGQWVAEIYDANIVINLAGKSVDCRYTEANKHAIMMSRLDPTVILGQAIAKASNPPSVWLNTSSATIYRHALDRPMDEESGEIGAGFSVDVCQRWERAFWDAPTPATRKVALRTSMVFGPTSGGAFNPFLDIVRRGIGGPMAGGRQYVSWIHEDDFARAVRWIVGHAELDGAVNVASPNPLPNREFLAEIRSAARVRPAIPTARWMLEVGAMAMGTETELLLKSRRVVPRRLLESGFEFRFPVWRDAVRDILARVRSAQ